MGQQQKASIRPIRIAPLPGESPTLESTSLARMRERGGAREFRDPQRLDFDLLMRIEHGHATHTVDFTDYPLVPGDLLWIRAGQVHQWGRIGDIEGAVVLFSAAALDDRTRDLVKAVGWRLRNHWSGADLRDSPAGLGWDLLRACLSATPRAPELHRAVAIHALGALVLLLAEETTDRVDRQVPTHEAYLWLRDEIEAQFTTMHKVTEYAARLGYSTRTLNRLAREHTGRTAKQLIDDRIVLEAKRLLTHAQDPVTRIAERLGFDDASNFSKYFQQRTGSTPAAFRGAVRGAPANLRRIEIPDITS
ncbi:helix-turn-helix transcriptional regulator [Nocardia sp. NPDC050710]|uniref:AraC family transcriptional regulator n=1 Tax=Nocardia sp. NPDC050710 TaxID=3157220 RepID=UPI0033FDCDB7